MLKKLYFKHTSFLVTVKDEEFFSKKLVSYIRNKRSTLLGVGPMSLNCVDSVIEISNNELQLEDTTGNIEFHIVASSTSVNISGTDHVKITVDYPFYTKPTSSFKYQLTGYIDTYTDTGNDTGFSNTNQTDNVTSLNYQIKFWIFVHLSNP